MLVGAIFIMILVPSLYSYLFYRKEKKEGNATLAGLYIGKAGKLSGVFLVVLLAFVAVMMFTGDIEFTCEKEALVIEADYWGDMTVAYDSIKSVEYLENDVIGSRTSGYGSARLLMGTFRNEEYGYYTRYSYTKCDSGIAIDMGKSMLIISGKDVDNTEKLYQEIRDRVNEIGDVVN